MAVYAYTRVSTDRQATEGESLAVQDRTVGGYALMHGLVVDRVFVERGVSGSKPLAERPEGRALVLALEPGDVVITAKLDRMFRSACDALAHLEAMERRRVALHMIDLGGDVGTDGVAKLVFTILSAVAEAERDRIRERITAVKSDQKRRGRYLGGKLPFGYAPNDARDLIELPHQQEAIALIHRMRSEGAALRTISARLADLGTSISHQRVSDILKRSDTARLASTT